MIDAGIPIHQTNSDSSSSSSSSSSSTRAGAMHISLQSVPGPHTAARVNEDSLTSSSSSSQEPPAPVHPTPCSLIATTGGASSDGAWFDSPLHKALHAAAALASVTAAAVGTGTGTDYTAVAQEAVDTIKPPPARTEELKMISEQGATTSIQQAEQPPTPPPTTTTTTKPAEENNTKKKRKHNAKSKQQAPIPQLPIVPLHNPYATATGGGGLSSHNIMYLSTIGVAPGGLPPPAGFHAMVPTNIIKGSEMPPIFRDRPQRSGKWTREEERYAELLIELLEKGHIDEKNGTTLRSYLSRKLHCAPMRISKKYAGKGIGKMVFLSKNSFRSKGGGIGSPAYHSNMKRLQQEESNFYKSCFRDLVAVPPIMLHIPPPGLLHAASSQPHGLIPFPPPPNMMNKQSLHPPILPHTAFAPSTNGLIVPNNFQPGSFVALSQPPYRAPPAPTAATTAAAVTNATKSPSPFVLPRNVPAVAVAPVAPPAKVPLTARQSLEQAYMNVAKTIQNENAIVAKGAGRIPYAPVNSTQGADSASVTNNNDAKSIQPAQQQAQPAPALTTNEMPDFLSGFDKVDGQGSPSKDVSRDGMDLAHHHSPTYTSRSFDDFHQLLGKTLTPEAKRQAIDKLMVPPFPFPSNSALHPKEAPAPFSPVTAAGPQGQGVAASAAPVGNTMDFSWGLVTHPFVLNGAQGSTSTAPVPLTQAQQVLQQATQQPPQHHQLMLTKAYGEALSKAAPVAVSHAPGANVGADSYSIFAQQSALAASHHSAYTSGPGDDGMAMSFADEMMIDMLFQQPTPPPAPSYSRNDNSSRINDANLAPHTMPNTRTPMHNPNHLVSEPSNSSDQGSDETPGDTSGFGTDNQADGSSNDSDGTNSESSRKKSRTTSSYPSHYGQPVDPQLQQVVVNQFYGNPQSFYGDDGASSYG